jgi:hypothetical protein
MGLISTSKVVTGAERRGRPKAKQPGNREWVTAVHCINTEGWQIPPMIILKGKEHQASWYQIPGLPTSWQLSVSENGWINDSLAVDLIKHFNKHTKSLRKGSKRLLIMDGHGSHHTAQFEAFCKEEGILTLCMPPHSSHLLQPLDVACFGPLKRSYGTLVASQIRLGINHITKEDFLDLYNTAQARAITEGNIFKWLQGRRSRSAQSGGCSGNNRASTSNNTTLKPGVNLGLQNTTHNQVYAETGCTHSKKAIWQ